MSRQRKKLKKGLTVQSQVESRGNFLRQYLQDSKMKHFLIPNLSQEYTLKIRNFLNELFQDTGHIFKSEALRPSVKPSEICNGVVHKSSQLNIVLYVL